MLGKVQCVVVGGGAVGLAVGRAIAQLGKEIVILERNTSIGSETSSRNSEVVHAGIYYPKNSLKALLCVRGKGMLYRYLAERNVAHSKCGKLIVATSNEQIAALGKIKQSAELNGVDDLEILDAESARTMEPSVRCVQALHSPNTGILDSHAYMENLKGDIEECGGSVVLGCDVINIQSKVLSKSSGLEYLSTDNFIVSTSQGTIEADYVINCSGLASTFLARKIIGFPEHLVPRSFFAKGNYFRLNTKPPFSRLVYPIPEPGGLGVHATIDLNGSVRFGPDVEWLKEDIQTVQSKPKSSSLPASFTLCSKDISYQFFSKEPQGRYSVDPARGNSFYSSIRKFYPELSDGALEADYSGIRPKLCGPSMRSDNRECGSDCSDFIVQGVNSHRVPGLVNLFGIESPGLTSSLAIGEYVAGRIDSGM